MTNFDKVKEELRIEDVGYIENAFCKAIHRARKENTCIGRNCEECKQWLAEEYVETVTLTEVERTILENVDKMFRYIARDKDGELCIYNELPAKELTTIWETDYGICVSLEPFNHLFQFVQWEDDEPYEIAELLKE